MPELKSIPGIGKTSLELLEAAGFRDASDLSRVDAEDLVRELERANRILKIAKRAPGHAVVSKWIASARETSGVVDEPSGPSLVPVDFERTKEVASMLTTCPFAIPLPARVLVENRLGVPDIPPGILLNRYSGDLDVRVEKRIPQGRIQQPVSHASFVQIAEQMQPKLEIDASRIRSVAEVGGPKGRLPVARTAPVNERVALIRAPRPETNQGRDPNSRRYIRGVLHSHPVGIYAGAVFTLILMLVVPSALLASALLLLSSEMPDRFGWVPKWFLVFPAVLPLAALCWAIWGLGGSCRICGQKLFVHKTHRKNAKAHHVRWLGYVLPLCVHILIFHWFRCTHCGTPVRLRK